MMTNSEVSPDQGLMTLADETLNEVFTAQTNYAADKDRSLTEVEYGFVFNVLNNVATHEAEYGKAGASEHVVDRLRARLGEFQKLDNPDFDIVQAETRVLHLAATAVFQAGLPLLSSEQHNDLALLSLDVETEISAQELGLMIYPELFQLDRRGLIHLVTRGSIHAVTIHRRDIVDKALKNRVARDNLGASKILEASKNTKVNR